jgi:cytochrome c oxidase subunit 1
MPPLKLSLAVHPPRRLPASLNGFRVWIWLILGLTIANYAYPIGQSVLLRDTGVPPYMVGAR